MEGKNLVTDLPVVKVSFGAIKAKIVILDKSPHQHNKKSPSGVSNYSLTGVFKQST